MKKLPYFSGIILVLMFSLGLSSCYVGYGPRYRSAPGPHYRSYHPHHYHGGHRHWR